MQDNFNVLSLFDGMSCGQLALNRAGIKYDNYYASEIDKYAIQVTQKNFPNTFQIGDVTKINTEYFKDIDLLLAGSPCQGFSFAGKQLAFEDPRSALFFEFIRILKEIKPKYFLLENVRMKKDFLNIISKQVGCKPILINSALVSAQNRQRFYWTNIPGVEQPKDKNILLETILEDDAVEPMLSNIYGGFGEKKPRLHRNKSVTIRTASGGGHIPSVTLKKYDKCFYRKLMPIEAERLQTVPEGYTEGVSNTQRYKMLGNGFTVEVICHILRNIRKITEMIKR